MTTYTNPSTRAAGGWATSRIRATATTNLNVVKASSGRVAGIFVKNDGAAKVYLKLYNKSTAPILATDVPVATWPIPIGGELNWAFNMGITFSVGIAYAITGAAADADATVVAADSIQGFLLFN